MAQFPAVYVASKNVADVAAIRLLAFATSMLPEGNPDFRTRIVNEILGEVMTFAPSARRCIEMERQDELTLAASCWEYGIDALGKAPRDLWSALSGVIHAHELHLHADHLLGPIYTQQRTTRILGIKYETDRRDEYVDLFSLVWTFFYRPRQRTHLRAGDT